MIKNIKKKIRIEEITFQIIWIISIKISAKEILPLVAIDFSKVEIIAKTPNERIGEKSIAPNLKSPRFEKKFKYGSHIFEKKDTTLYGNPGIQVKKIRITHINE